MYGTVPAYRTLEKGVSNGPDVSQLNRNLKALGFDPYDEIGELDHFSAATARAVKRWQKAEGLKQTGKVELGRVVFAPAAQRVTKVDVALGQDPPGTTEARRTTARPARRSTTTAPTTETPADTKPGRAHRNMARAREGQELLAREGRRTPRKRARPPPSKAECTGRTSSKRSAPRRKRLDPRTRAQTHGWRRRRDARAEHHLHRTDRALDLKADQQQLAHVGESAPVTLPSGRVVQGRITEVGTVANRAAAEEDREAKARGTGKTRRSR